MTTLLPLAIKLLPFYCYIFLGYIAGKKLVTNQDSISNIMFYLVTPIIVFNSALNTPVSLSALSIPILTFSIACILCLLFYQIARKIWTDSSKNLVAFSAGSGATGYFGIPLAMLIFTPEKEGLYILALLGITLYDYSLGYYISARGTCTARECFKQLLRIPILYAFALGFAFNYFQFEQPLVYKDFVGHIKGVYIVMGMMIVGMGISQLTSFKLDFKFIGLTFLAKFLIWPLMILAVISLDLNYLGIYSPNIHQALILLSIVPIAINTVIMASISKVHPEKASATVMLGILFALIYVPFMADLLLTD